MPPFLVNPHRVDPYKATRFRVSWGGRPVPGVMRVSGLGWALAERGAADGAKLPDGGPAPRALSGGPTVAQVLDPLGIGMLVGLLASRREEQAPPQQPVLHARPAPVVLERGRTHDTSFEDWAEEVALDAAGGRRREVTKDVVVELDNEAGQPALAFVLRGCLPIAYEALGPLDANTDAVASERLTLAYERLERNRDLPEPNEPRA